ncbi:helix-turn-helix domain-containing protein, partial [Oxalobacteraceae bacterium OM1]
SPLNAATLPGGREVPLTQEELGHLLGKSRQSIAKLLREWERTGLVETKYGRISITDADALNRIAYPEPPMARRKDPR